MKPIQIKGRTGWHAEVHLPDGRTARKKFQYEKEARAWLSSEQARVDAAPEAAFGGPARVTLGALLVEYAKLKTQVKDGYQAEIDRINHYVTAAGYLHCDGRDIHATRLHVPRLAYPLSASSGDLCLNPCICRNGVTVQLRLSPRRSAVTRLRASLNTVSHLGSFLGA